MLTRGIRNAYEEGTSKISSKGNVETLATGAKGEAELAVGAKVFYTSMDNYEKNPDLAEEVFGPSSVLVQANTKESILAAARALEGHLTATVHGTEEDLQEFAELIHIASFTSYRQYIPILLRCQLLFNCYPCLFFLRKKLLNDSSFCNHYLH